LFAVKTGAKNFLSKKVGFGFGGSENMFEDENENEDEGAMSGFASWWGRRFLAC